MSLDDFFNKKSKKKSKTKINTQELFEKITDVPKPSKQELDKVEESESIEPLDTDDWEPIVNDDIDVDLSNIRINDLSVVKAEEEQAVAETLNAAKAEESKVVWGSKAKEDDGTEDKEEVPKPAPVEPPQSTRPSAYVPLHLRSGGARPAPAQAQPNIESAEEFPTLGEAVTQEPKKKAAPTKEEPVDPSWREVSKPSSGHRNGTAPPAHLRQTGDNMPGDYVRGSSYASNLARRTGGGLPTPDAYAPNPSAYGGGGASAWRRGDVVKSSQMTSGYEPPRISAASSGWARRSANDSASARPSIRQERDILSFTQENRFAQLDDA